MSIRILFTIPNFITAGSGRAMLNVIERLDRRQFSPAVCVMRRGGGLDQVIDELGIPLIEAPFTTPARPYHSLPLRAWVTAQLFRPYRFSIWHSFHYLDDYTEAMIARLAGATLWMYTKKNMSWGNRAWWLRSRLARGIAAQNSAMIEMFFRSIPATVRVIPPGVDTQLYYPSPAQENLRARLGIPEEVPLIGHVAHFVPVKNHLHLIRALNYCQTSAHLVFAGRPQDQQYVEQVRQLVTELHLEDRVHFLGEVLNIPDFLRSLDIFAFCSHQEACPVAVLEAMACCLPCVVTDIPGMRDIHVQNETAIVAPPNDVAAFALGLDRLAASSVLRKQMGHAAMERVQVAFSVEREAAQYTKLYLDLINGTTTQ